MSKLGAFLRRHKHAEAEAVEAAGMTIGWKIAARILAVGVASAAVAVPTMIDLSNNNGPGAASAISAAGVHAVEAKATEGVSFRDRDYPVFRAAAARAHRPFGAYVFLHPGIGGKAQADYFLAYAHPRPGDLQPVVDSEMGSPYSAAPATYAALHELELKGYRPLLYASSSYLGVLVSRDARLRRFRVWQAEYGPTLHRVPGTIVVAWQNTDHAIVAGRALDGSRLLVGVSTLTIPRAKPRPTPSQVRASRLRAEHGFWPWLEWYLGEGDWRGYGVRRANVRPKAPHTISRAWWAHERAFLHARK